MINLEKKCINNLHIPKKSIIFAPAIAKIGRSRGDIEMSKIRG